MEAMNAMLTFAEVTETSSVGATFIGWIILIGICYGIYNACNRPREFDIYGKIKERR